MVFRFLLVAVGLLPALAWGLDADALREDAPSVYTVKKGDTLWDIAGKFLHSPWRWPELWDRNPYISNPDLIYPGDRLRLSMVNGEPRLSRQKVERLSPEVASAPAERLEAITTVDRSVVLPYIDRYGLLPADQDPATVGGRLVTGQTERVMYATGDQVFARLDGGDDPATEWYTFSDPQPVRGVAEDRHLGYLVEHTGLVTVEGPADGELYSARVERTYAPIRRGDHLYPGRAAAAKTRFLPKPAPPVAGRILRHVGEESMLGQGQMVVLDLGARDRLERGHVLQVRDHPRQVSDPQSGKTSTIQGRRKGTLLVIQTSERLSFALIMENTRPIARGDRVRQPETE
ncbi:MAG TPA: LysM domain-containing protein [Gammaproteobacteria bacterium]|nr:LysM domain-containing protein [Gammaproteobacteria bacterium]